MKSGLFLFLGTLIFILFLISSSSAYEIFYYHTDNLGSPVAITDENASVVWSADYEPRLEKVLMSLVEITMITPSSTPRHPPNTTITITNTMQKN